MRTKQLLTLLFCMVFVVPVMGQKTAKRNLLREKKAAFFASDEARRIGDNVLAYQRDTGGWPKNIDMTRELDADELAEVLKDKAKRDDSTTDNGATTTQMTFLARLYSQTGDAKYREAFRKAVGYLLQGQYDNGGWPQFWPGNRGYQVHITYNDDAMIHTMLLLRDIGNGTSPYSGDLVDSLMRERVKTAFDKGIDCILKTQIVADGKPTIWCQQHDHITLLPAKARAYELPSYCPMESSAIVRLLIELPAPTDSVKRAVNAAMSWFEEHKLTGLRYERAPVKDGKTLDARLVSDPEAEPLWARYYDLEECLPYVCDRDGVSRRSLDEIGTERRNGYVWYGNQPAGLYKLYSAWKEKYCSGSQDRNP